MSSEEVHRVLVLGGVRSGKSVKAMEIASQYGSGTGHNLYYVATGVEFDLEMKSRIEKHKKSRDGDKWRLIEEPFEIDSVIREKSDRNSTLLIDCLSVWLGNFMSSYYSDREGVFRGSLDLEDFLRDRVARLVDSVRSSEGNIVLVGSETGLGIIPLGREVRVFGDISGEMNQALAIESDRVVFVIAGIARELKS